MQVEVARCPSCPTRPRSSPVVVCKSTGSDQVCTSITASLPILSLSQFYIRFSLIFHIPTYRDDGNKGKEIECFPGIFFLPFYSYLLLLLLRLLLMSTFPVALAFMRFAKTSFSPFSLGNRTFSNYQTLCSTRIFTT